MYMFPTELLVGKSTSPLITLHKLGDDTCKHCSGQLNFFYGLNVAYPLRLSFTLTVLYIVNHIYMYMYVYNVHTCTCVHAVRQIMGNTRI